MAGGDWTTPASVSSGVVVVGMSDRRLDSRGGPETMLTVNQPSVVQAIAVVSHSARRAIGRRIGSAAAYRSCTVVIDGHRTAPATFGRAGDLGPGSPGLSPPFEDTGSEGAKRVGSCRGPASSGLAARGGSLMGGRSAASLRAWRASGLARHGGRSHHHRRRSSDGGHPWARAGEQRLVETETVDRADAVPSAIAARRQRSQQPSTCANRSPDRQQRRPRRGRDDRPAASPAAPPVSSTRKGSSRSASANQLLRVEPTSRAGHGT